MRAYLPAAAFSVAFLAWLFSGSGREGASEAHDADAAPGLRSALPESAPVEATGSVRQGPPDEAPRRSVRIVYPPPYEAR